MDARAWFYRQGFVSGGLATDERQPETPKPNMQPVEIWDGRKWVTRMVEIKPDAKA